MIMILNLILITIVVVNGIRSDGDVFNFDLDKDKSSRSYQTNGYYNYKKIEQIPSTSWVNQYHFQNRFEAFPEYVDDSDTSASVIDYYPSMYESQEDVTHRYPDISEYRPKFLTQRRKIEVPKKTTTPEPNIRYIEIELQRPKKSIDAKKEVSETMRKYFVKFLIDQYGYKLKSDNNNTLPSNGNSTKNFKLDEEEPKILSSNLLWDLKNKTISKIKQFFSIFTVIKFNNTECNATNWAGAWQGVCLSNIECTNSNGIALGDCANGYGACCVFRGSCGDSSSRNCTYFKSPNYPDYYPTDGGGVARPSTTEVPTVAPTPDPRKYWYYRQSSSDATECTFMIYKTSADVQQIRIDFIDLDLAGPTNGICTNESLLISGQNSNDQIPPICGYNTGQHVYVDVSNMDGPIELMIISTTGAQKRFKLKICQFTDSCTSQSNCLQYYTGTDGVIQSFNYDQAAMFNRSVAGYFNNLNYAICIRREAGYCSITFTNVDNNMEYPFQMVNRLTGGQSTVPAGQAGVDVLNCPDDYIIIDGTRLCGDRFNDGSTVTSFSMNAPVTDTSTGPIVVSVRTNNNSSGLGFKLFYTQNPCP